MEKSTDLNKTIERVLGDYAQDKVTDHKDLARCESELNFSYPKGLKAFYSVACDLETDAGNIWNCKKTVDVTKEYSYDKQFPDFVILGSDGGGEYLGFKRVRDAFDDSYYTFTMTGDGEDAILVAKDFVTLLDFLVKVDIDVSITDLL